MVDYLSNAFSIINGSVTQARSALVPNDCQLMRYQSQNLYLDNETDCIEFDPNDPVDFVIIKSYRPDDSTKNPDYYITGIENDNYYPIIMNDLRGPPGPKGLHGMY